MGLLFRGVGTAIITPFTATGAINFPVLGQLIENQEQAGIKTIVVNGTTSEAATLADDEQFALVEFVANHVQSDTMVIAGVSSNETKHACGLAKRFSALPIAGMLVLTPYYNRANDSGMIAHFEAIIAETTLPVILYHIPSRTGCGISFPVLQKMAENPQVSGIKFADSDYGYAMAILGQLCHEDFALYSGNDDMTFALVAMGAAGSISAAANLLPKELLRLYDALSQFDLVLARELHFGQLELLNALFMETNPIPVKYAMRLKGYDVGGFRLPLCDPELATQKLLKQLVLGEEN
ncbi:MAG: 4-hydroxy-tetrahydrodipicolinate synthase [Culicoidibacterales bacterium]